MVQRFLDRADTREKVSVVTPQAPFGQFPKVPNSTVPSTQVIKPVLKPASFTPPSATVPDPPAANAVRSRQSNGSCTALVPVSSAANVSAADDRQVPSSSAVPPQDPNSISVSHPEDDENFENNQGAIPPGTPPRVVEIESEDTALATPKPHDSGSMSY